MRPPLMNEAHLTATKPERELAVAVACVFCKGKLAREESVYCAACLAPHHDDCWEENGRCGACAALDLVRATPPPLRRRRPNWTCAVGTAVQGLVGAAGTWVLVLVVASFLRSHLTGMSRSDLPAARPAPSTTPVPVPDARNPRTSATLHVVAVHEPESELRPGTVTVEIAKGTTPIVLALSSREPARFRLTGSVGRVLQVILGGRYGAHEVEGLGPHAPPCYAPLVPYTPDTFSRTWYDLQLAEKSGARQTVLEYYRIKLDEEGPGYARAIRNLEELSGLPLASFQGRFASRRFVVPRAEPDDH